MRQLVLHIRRSLSMHATRRSLILWRGAATSSRSTITCFQVQHQHAQHSCDIRIAWAIPTSFCAGIPAFVPTSDSIFPITACVVLPAKIGVSPQLQVCVHPELIRVTGHAAQLASLSPTILEAPHSSLGAVAGTWGAHSVSRPR